MSSQPLRVALVGTGFGSRVQLPAFELHPDTRVVAVCSSRIERARAVAREHGIERFGDDYHKLVADPDVDVVSIAAPPHLHHPVAIAALRAGKHVLCEKPFAMNKREAADMVAAARRAGKAGMVDHEFRWLPVRARIKELVDDGWLGDLQRIAIVESTTWMAARSSADITWQAQAKYGGGVLGALGSHYIDYCRWVAGDIEHVDAALRTLVEKRTSQAGETIAVDADDNFSLRLEHKSGVVSSVELCATTNAATSAMFAFGGKGALHAAGTTLWGLRAGAEPVPVTTKPPVRFPLPAGAHQLLGPFLALTTEMVKCVRGEPSAVPTFEDGVRVQEVLDAARRSSTAGRRVKV